MQNALIIDGLFRDNPAPDYVVIDGHSYERLEPNTENIELDLDDETEKNLVKLMQSGEFVNKQDAIRHVIRTAIKDSTFLTKISKKKTTKKSK